MRIIIFGGSGFIGAHLVRCFSAEGHEVIALCRTGKVTGFAGEAVSWSFGQSVPQRVLEKAECAIHLAHDFSGKGGALRTINGTIGCVETLHLAGVKRQIYFSSYSAGPHARSLYGKTKYLIEQAIRAKANMLIVRPGLVMGKGGIYGRISRWVSLCPVMPLPDGGKGLVPIITVEKLGIEIITLATARSPAIESNLFYPKLRSLRQLVVDAALKEGRHSYILPLPAGLIFFGLRVASILHIPLPINVDNLISFLSNQSATHCSTLSD